jgi:hypothetical protein
MAGKTTFKPEYCDMIIEHFRVQPSSTKKKVSYYPDGAVKSEEEIPIGVDFPTFQGFADKIGVHVDTLHKWKDDNAEFSEAYARAKQLQEHIWLINGMNNLYNSQFAQFFGKNCLGYKDKTETEITGINNNTLIVHDVSALSDEQLERLIEISDSLRIEGEIVDIK